MYGPTYFYLLEPGGLHEITKLLGCPKHRRLPSWIAEPTAETAIRSPKAPATELSDHKPPFGLEHASHFRGRALLIANEAKHGHSYHAVKRFIVEWQVFDLPLDELHWHRREFNAPLGGCDHRRVCVKPCYDRAMPSHFRCNFTIATANVQQGFAGNRIDQLKEELPL
jgi:hypothetical protein